MMHGREKSDSAIVAAKLANNDGQPYAESVERRAGAEGNAGQDRTHRAQDRESVSQGLDRVRHVARTRKKERFTALLHHVSPELLRTAFLALKRQAAPGVDGLTWQTYEADLDSRIEDLHERGLDQRVLFIVCGEFGRTPKIQYQDPSGRPGRDHWPMAMSFLFSGGGITPGQVIGATDARGEHAIERRVGVQDFGATLYHHLGIDPQQVQITNFAGRPIPVLQDGKPIPELIG